MKWYNSTLSDPCTLLCPLKQCYGLDLGNIQYEKCLTTYNSCAETWLSMLSLMREFKELGLKQTVTNDREPLIKPSLSLSELLN